MSAGIRSGVNWMRLKRRSSDRASVFTSSVLASPGTPCSSPCPPASSAISTCSTTSCWPMITRRTAASTRAARARASSRDIGGSTAAAGEVVLTIEAKLSRPPRPVRRSRPRSLFPGPWSLFSYRSVSATAGSVEAARRAGSTHATKATATITTATPPITRGSIASTS